MAKSDAVWGIDIGQCALKAIRCRPHEQADKIVAEAFDYIEYPQILSQPGADPVELVREAFKTFLSRNDISEDSVAISVPGQAGLARFIKLPPVEAKKIPDIVRYEARQQIPFNLDEVVWDFQRMGPVTESDGFALETEIGLFAMKRDQVLRALEPFEKASIDVDIVQLTPLALYNFLRFDQLRDLPPADEYDPENPPESTVILSLGTDASDLVVTNGYRVWQRNIPMGGNHFTRALTKELKLTFPKAEHLKRNATAAQDPKAVFQAMRPVFSDLLQEVQRSIGYFSSIDRAAKICKVVVLGNAVKLPGLRKYLEQNLQLDVQRLESFRGLVGGSVLTAPAFQENLASFGVAYGLAVQGLGKAGVSTNLVPKEIVLDRTIRQKKPWALAVAALIMLACTISFFSFWRSYKDVEEPVFKTAEAAANSARTMSSDLKKQEEDVYGELDKQRQSGRNLVGNIEGRIVYLEVLKAINDCLPRDNSQSRAGGDLPTEKDIEQRNEVHITGLEFIRVEKLEDWFARVQKFYEPGPGEKPLPKPGDDPSAPPPGGGNGPAAGPQGPGWVVVLTGKHYHNSEHAGSGKIAAQYLRDTFLHNLQTAKIHVPAGLDTPKEDILLLKEIGVGWPVLINPSPIREVMVENPNVDVDDRAAAAGGAAATAPARNQVKVREFDFEIQLCWQPMPPSKRHAPAGGEGAENRVTAAP